MPPTFQTTLWRITVPPPWKAEVCEECVELTQPEGVGALHISGARKIDGIVLEHEALFQLQQNCPEDTETESVLCGDFAGYTAEYVDRSEGIYWKNWFVARRQVLLFISYNCKCGEEDVEATEASALLSSLQCRE